MKILKIYTWVTLALVLSLLCLLLPFSTAAAAGIQTSAGAHPGNDIQFSISAPESANGSGQADMTPPTIKSVTPAGNAAGVSIRPEITAGFFRVHEGFNNQ